MKGQGRAGERDRRQRRGGQPRLRQRRRKQRYLRRRLQSSLYTILADHHHTTHSLPALPDTRRFHLSPFLCQTMERPILYLPRKVVMFMSAR